MAKKKAKRSAKRRGKKAHCVQVGKKVISCHKRKSLAKKKAKALREAGRKKVVVRKRHRPKKG